MRRNLLSVIMFICSSVLFSQKLPTGAFHDNRSRTYDIHHYKAELEFDFENRKVTGTTTIKFTPLRELNSFSLDAISMRIQNVSGVAGMTFKSTPTTIDFTLPQNKGPADTLTIVVNYACNPQGGMYFRRNQDNPKLFYVSTYGEGGLHANWLPIYNDVNDKFSTEMIVSVPPPYVVISNGELLNQSARRDGTVAYHWLQKLPHPNYLISIYVGDFEKGDLAPAFGTIPLSYWVPRGRLREGAYAFRNSTKMIEYFSKRFNYKYPWVKYDQIAVPDYAIGAMEHTGVTGHRASVLREASAPDDFGPPALEEITSPWSAEATISHEAAHHWFGNNLTCRNLSYIWLNESFASYLMMLWDEESLGQDQLRYSVLVAKDHYFRFVRNHYMIRGLEHHNFDNTNAIYNEEHTYLKGAAVLHMLRAVLGDEPYFRALSHYLHKHQFANVISEDLKIAIEEAAGENLHWFFDDWIANGGHPNFEVRYRYLAEKKLIDLSVNQVQPIVKGQDLFRLPVKITIATPSRTWQERVWVENESERFSFPCAEKPLMVSFDGEGDLIAEIKCDKEIDELIYQAKHDALPGRIWAIRELSNRFPVATRTAAVLSEIIASNAFWAVRAEAALHLGAVRTPAAQQALELALQASDYRIRKGAVLALPKFGAVIAEPRLKQVITKDTHTDVVAAAILALAQANPKQDPSFITRQLGRQSWYDEITIACVRAFGLLKNASLLATIKTYTDDRYNQDVRLAAVQVWSEIAPADKDLHKTLLDLTHSPVYALQQAAIGMLGSLQVEEAVTRLKAIVEADADANLSVPAREALGEIERAQKQ